MQKTHALKYRFNLAFYMDLLKSKKAPRTILFKGLTGQIVILTAFVPAKAGTPFSSSNTLKHKCRIQIPPRAKHVVKVGGDFLGGSE